MFSGSPRNSNDRNLSCRQEGQDQALDRMRTATVHSKIVEDSVSAISSMSRILESVQLKDKSHALKNIDFIILLPRRDDCAFRMRLVPEIECTLHSQVNFYIRAISKGTHTVNTKDKDSNKPMCSFVHSKGNDLLFLLNYSILLLYIELWVLLEQLERRQDQEETTNKLDKWY